MSYPAQFRCLGDDRVDVATGRRWDGVVIRVPENRPNDNRTTDPGVGVATFRLACCNDNRTTDPGVGSMVRLAFPPWITPDDQIPAGDLAASVQSQGV